MYIFIYRVNPILHLRPPQPNGTHVVLRRNEKPHRTEASVALVGSYIYMNLNIQVSYK